MELPEESGNYISQIYVNTDCYVMFKWYYNRDKELQVTVNDYLWSTTTHGHDRVKYHPEHICSLILLLHS